MNNLSEEKVLDLTPDEQKELALFTNLSNKLVTPMGKTTWKYSRRVFDYPTDLTIEEVTRRRGNIVRMRQISQSFYRLYASYRRMCDFLANIYCYYWQYDIIGGSKLKKKDFEKLYYETINWLSNLKIETTFQEISKTVVVEGVYFGYVAMADNHPVLVKLDPAYCRARYQSYYGTKMVEFNLSYFNRYTDEDERNRALRNFPSQVRRAYNSGNYEDGWVVLPPELACVFYLSDDLVPPIYDSIIDIINFNDYKDIEKERDSQELEKILIQQFKFDTEGNLKILLQEMAALHSAIATALKDKDKIDVITTMADTVKVEDTQAASSVARDNLAKMLVPKYENAGLSYELFASTTATSLESSITNSTSFMSTLINQYSNWINCVLSCTFIYPESYPQFIILPVTWYNRQKMLDSSLKSAQYGYSLRAPFIIMGVPQSSIFDHKYLENDIFNMRDILIPVSSSYTEESIVDTSDAGKANEKPMEEKSEKTIQNIESK